MKQKCADEIRHCVPGMHMCFYDLWLPFWWFACSQAWMWASGLQPFCAHTRMHTPCHTEATNPQTHTESTPHHTDTHTYTEPTHLDLHTHTCTQHLPLPWLLLEHLPHLLCDESNVSFHWLTTHPLGSRVLVLVAVELKITNVVQLCWWVHLVWWEEGGESQHKPLFNCPFILL